MPEFVHFLLQFEQKTLKSKILVLTTNSSNHKVAKVT